MDMDLLEGNCLMKNLLLSFKYAFNPKKPLMMIRLCWNFVLMLVFKRDLLRYVDFAIGYKCNLECDHCFTKGQKVHGRISPRYYAKVAKQAMKMGAINFSFQGGEPLMYPDLKEYIKAVKPYLNIISVTTNGTLLDEVMAKNLKHWGVDIITLSYDEMRDNTYFQKALKAAQSAGLKVTVGVVITDEQFFDFGKMDAVISFAKKKKIIVMIIFPAPIGKWQGNSSVMLSPEAVKYIRYIEQQEQYIRTDFQANYYRRGCGAAKEILYITPDGEVYCCPFIPISFGNVKDLQLKHIRQRMLKVKYLKEYWPKCLAGEDGGIWGKF